jgi:hypothetical protein
MLLLALLFFGTTMPSLFRFLFAVALICGTGYVVMYALANWIHPQPREITVTVPSSAFFKER